MDKMIVVLYYFGHKVHIMLYNINRVGWVPVNFHYLVNLCSTSSYIALSAKLLTLVVSDL